VSLTRGVTGPVTRPLTRAITAAGSGGFNPTSLYAAGEQGAFYDSADFAAMFQNSVGDLPVTAVGQPVGLTLDKRLGLVRGAELVVNGTFDSSLTGWTNPDTAPGTSTASGGGALMSNGTTGTARLRQSLAVPASSFELSFTVSGFSGASNATTLSLGNSGAGDATYGSVAITANGTYTRIITGVAAGTLGLAFLVSNISTSGATIDNVSVKQLAGNHATQATAAARPVIALSGASRFRDFDAIDDAMVTTFPNLGTAVTIARSLPGSGASILTAQTIGAGVWSTSTDDCALIIIDRALTALETTNVTAFLNARAGL